MTLEEAKLTLKIDTNDEDNRIQLLLNAIPPYIYQCTGLTPEKQNDEPLVKIVSEFLLITWHQHTEQEIYLKTIESLLTTIKLKVVEENARARVESNQ